MASTTLVVKNHSNIDVSYVLSSGAQNASEFVYRNTALTLREPCLVTMKQELRRPGQAGAHKHFVSVKRTTVNVDGDAKPHSFGISLLITDDPDTTLTEADKLDLMTQFKNLLTDERTIALLDGVIS